MIDSRAGGRWRAHLELVRPPALFTAGADSLTGWGWALGVVSMKSDEHLSLIGLCLLSLVFILISGSIYAAGMCTNDIFDAEEDLRDRPFRPIPSGRVSLKMAWRLALSLQALAIGLALLISVTQGTVDSGLLGWSLLATVLATVIATYLYNRLFKESVIAPLFMGLCRLGNFWIGASALVVLSPKLAAADPSLLWTPMALSCGTFLYVSALTAMSRFEVEGGRGARWCAWALLLASTHPLWWIGSGLLGRAEGVGIGLSIGTGLSVGIGLSVAIGLSVMVSLWIFKGLRSVLLSEAMPAEIERAVGVGIRGVALTNLVLCVALEAWWLALLLACMTWGAGRVGRWFYAT